MDSAENIPSSPPKTEFFSLLLSIRQNDNNVDLIPCFKCYFASYKKSRNLKNFTNLEKYFCDFILRFINEDFSDDNIENILSSRGRHDSRFWWLPVTTGYQNFVSGWLPVTTGYQNLVSGWLPVTTGYQNFGLRLVTGYHWLPNLTI